MKTKNIVVVLLVLALFAGCSEDFLDTKQQGVQSVNDFYKTEQEAFQGILGCYDMLQIWFLSVEYSPIMTYTMMSDEVYCGGSTRGDALKLEEVNEFRHGANNMLMYDMFQKPYFGIYRSNTILEKVAGDTPAQKVILAEAKAFRAFWYFHLVFNFGDVPLVTSTLKPSEFAQPRVPAAQVWAQIEKDLQEAIADLPLKSQQSTRDKARWSKGAAQALLGKVYLFQEKYTEAAAEFQKVIDSDEYGLYPDFSKVLRKSSELGVESLFEVMQPITNYSSSSLPPRAEGPFGDVTLERSRWFRFLGPKGGGWFVAGSLNISDRGFNFECAKYSMYQAFIDANDPVRRASTILNEDEVKAAGGKLRNPLFATSELPEGTLAYSSDPCLRLKYTLYIDETAGPDVNLNYGTNVRLIRYADVLLMAAEAYNRKPNPDNTKALQYINEVRDRVNLTPLTETGDALFNAIKTERRLELMFEGHRYHDLIRWGDAMDVMKDQGKLVPRGDGTFLTIDGAGFKERNWLMPIPEQELAVNPNMTQNPGY